MKKTFSYLMLGVFSASIFSAALLYGQDEGAGKKVFETSKCTTCHSVESKGIIKGKKDLSLVGETLKAEQIKAYITKKDKMNDKMHPIAFKGEEKDLDSLVTWLASLKK